MSNPNDETAKAVRARNGRNVLLALSLLAFVVMIFAITVVKISGNVVTH